MGFPGFPKKKPVFQHIPTSNHPFPGAMLVFREVVVILDDLEAFKQLFLYATPWCLLSTFDWFMNLCGEIGWFDVCVGKE